MYLFFSINPCLESLVHWVWSFLALACSYRMGVVPMPAMPTSLWDQPLWKGWPDFIFSVIVIEFLWRGNMCCSLISCPALVKLPTSINFAYFLSILISLETVFHLPAWSTLSYLPPLSLVPCPVCKCLQLLAGVICSHHLAIPWSDQACSIANFLSPGGLSFW